VSHEAKIIRAAIRTDFILSVEIIVITLVTVFEQSFAIQSMVVTFIALLTTFAVYGLVALLVRMDDAGFSLIENARQQDSQFKALKTGIGKGLIAALPKVIRFLMIVGTIAMLLVGGGLFVHNIEYLHHLLDFMPSILSDFVAGLVIGSLIVLALLPFHKPNQKTAEN